MSEEFTEQMQVRLEKMEAHRESGLDPFGGKYTRTHVASELKALYDRFTKEELAAKEDETEVTVAGRLMTKRGKGKAGFAHIQDASGQIQIYVRQDEIGKDAYDIYKTIDLGDNYRCDWRHV